jgi:hypothetical protein
MNTACFVRVPETRLPGGLVVPAFEVSQFLCSKRIGPALEAQADSVADLPPWTWITYAQAVKVCLATGWTLIRESQWLAIAFDLVNRSSNWSGGAVGAGKLWQGLHQDSVESPCAAILQPSDENEPRWKTLSNGRRLCDFGGNAWSWVHDDIQGSPRGMARILDPDSISLTTAPYPPREQGMGIRPASRQVWDGRALIRGGSFRCGEDAGAFALYAALAPSGYQSVGFRATRPISGEPS